MQMNYAKEIKARTSEFRQYLESGRYTADDQFRVIFKASKRNSPILAGLNVEVLDNRVSIPQQTPAHFAGNMLWFCSNGDVKIFSDSEVLTLCCSQDNYVRKISNYDYFSRFFRIPAWICRDDKNYILVEKLVTFENKKDQDDAFLLETIYNDYTHYFNYIYREAMMNYRSINDLIRLSPNTTHRKEFEDIIHLIDPCLFEVSFPFMRLHGDLWTDNLLLKKESTDDKQLWYIDWDASGEYIFFYDFFKFIWNELDVHDNNVYYDRYVKGEYDVMLGKIFAIFDLEFRPEQKSSYFCMFFLNTLLEDNGVMAYEVKRMELADFQRKVVAFMKDS
ncbi:phosphotransferase [Gracilibacillus phocaeensis]|uniref:phosphotransferase n=1 Tax=Gracilibacillus phocaeensis TaxID=2042304 RepID=UPI0010308E6B|nr:phosphotransferase [Gracilibacillus phocaeensis]